MLSIIALQVVRRMPLDGLLAFIVCLIMKMMTLFSCTPSSA